MAKTSSSERIEALRAWLTANGINPNDVPLDADMTISEGTAGRFLCCEVFDLTSDGRRQLDERGTNAAVTVVAMPLKVEPPEWWQPYEKPTRDQLLTVVERVRKLHHDWENDPGHCAHCTGPDGNLVRFPCATVQALDGALPTAFSPGGNRS